jgi:hypothetical protein
MGHWGTGSLEYWIVKRIYKKKGIMCKKHKATEKGQGGSGK